MEAIHARKAERLAQNKLDLIAETKKANARRKREKKEAAAAALEAKSSAKSK